uniref:Beta-defensin n=1 Tax=Ornithorhynchus anatinus TaxID=9258 RepID=A0A6I8NNA8_ORNAN
MSTLIFLFAVTFLLLHLPPGKMEVFMGTKGRARNDLYSSSYGCIQRAGLCRQKCLMYEYRDGDCGSVRGCCVSSRRE